MVWNGLAWYSMVWYGMVWYGMVWYGIYVCMHALPGMNLGRPVAYNVTFSIYEA